MARSIDSLSSSWAPRNVPSAEYKRVRPLHLVDHRRLQIARASGGEELRRYPEDLRDRPVRLLAPAAVLIGELDQAGSQEHADVKVKMSRIDAESLSQLTVRELPVAILAEHLQHPDA